MEGRTRKAEIKVAALCGSLRKASFNRGLIRAAEKICLEGGELEGMEIEYVEIGQLPMFNVDLEVNGAFPPAVEAFHRKLSQADCLFFASPEHNYAISAVMKNALDWGSRAPNVWDDKAAAIMSAGGEEHELSITFAKSACFSTSTSSTSPSSSSTRTSPHPSSTTMETS